MIVSMIILKTSINIALLCIEYEYNSFLNQIISFESNS